MKPRRNMTPEQLNQAQESLRIAASVAGSVNNLAKDAGVTTGQVYKWIRRTYISATGAASICSLKKYKDAGLTKEKMCPDVKVWFI